MTSGFDVGAIFVALVVVFVVGLLLGLTMQESYVEGMRNSYHEKLETCADGLKISVLVNERLLSMTDNCTQRLAERCC
jgi:hypothetical protein